MPIIRRQLKLVVPRKRKGLFTDLEGNSRIKKIFPGTSRVQNSAGSYCEPGYFFNPWVIFTQLIN